MNKNFNLILSAKTISSFGDVLDSLGFAWLMYSLTNSPLMMGSVLAMNALPSLIFGFFTGKIVDEKPKKILSVIADLCRMMIIFLKFGAKK